MSEPLTDSTTPATAAARQSWSPWRVVVGFGTISLTADMVYEGGRSVYGPLLSSLGASALAVGAITGAGEAAALLLRLVLGDAGRPHPPVLGGDDHRVRAHRGVRAAAGGHPVPRRRRPRGRDRAHPGRADRQGDPEPGEVGAARRRRPARRHGPWARGAQGPRPDRRLRRAVARRGLVALAGAVLWPGFAVLAVPGAVAMVLLVLTRHRMPSEQAIARSAAPLADAYAAPDVLAVRHRLGRLHGRAGDLRPGQLPPRRRQDRPGRRRAAALRGGDGRRAPSQRCSPARRTTGSGRGRCSRCRSSSPPCRRSRSPEGCAAIIGGVLIWGAAVGLQDSTVKALVADLVRPDRRATAYGMFAAVQGAGALIGGIATGALYEHSARALVIAVLASQVLAAGLIVGIARRPAEA